MSELKNLIALTKLHLSQHYKNSAFVFTTPESLKYYQTFAKSHTQGKKKEVLPVKRVAKPFEKQPVKDVNKAPLITKKPPIEKKSTSDKKQVPREFTRRVEDVDFSQIQKIMNQYFESSLSKKSPPADDKAKKVATAWKTINIKPEIIILDAGRSPLQKKFLQNLAQALNVWFYKTAILSVDSLQDIKDVRLVLAEACHLERVSFPKVIMQNVDHYLKEPKEKALLWQDITNTLQSS